MEKPFAAYTGEDSFIFVSYAHADDALVYPELQRLKDRGFNVWYDEGISPGSEWTDALASAIERCDVFLYFVSPRSVASEHCQRELNFSLDQRCTLLVVHLEETEIPRALRLSFGNRQAIIKHELSDEAYAAKLFSGVGDRTGRSDFVSTAPLRASGSKHRSAIVVLGLAALAILVVAAIFLFRSPTSPSDDADVAIAVLPLVNMSADPSNEYFSDGVSAEILNSLVRTNTLPVIARTSSFQFKGKSLSVQEIASELNAFLPAGYGSRAEALNNHKDPQVVGWSWIGVEQQAVLWESHGGAAWTATDLNNAFPECSAVELEQAHDINDDGWIAAWGTVNPPGLAFERHAVVLSPVGPNPSDLNGDGIVGINDFLELLGTWGPCRTGVVCRADLDLDCTVGITDLLRMFGDWTL